MMEKQGVYFSMFDLYEYMLNSEGNQNKCYAIVTINSAYSIGGSYHIIM